MARLDKNLTMLSLSSCLGGSGYDEGRNVVIDAGGNVYLTGRTLSPNDDPSTAELETPFPTTEGAQDRSCGIDGFCKYVDEDGRTRRGEDAFVTKITTR